MNKEQRQTVERIMYGISQSATSAVSRIRDDCDESTVEIHLDTITRNVGEIEQVLLEILIENDEKVPLLPLVAAHFTDKLDIGC